MTAIDSVGSYPGIPALPFAAWAAPAQAVPGAGGGARAGRRRPLGRFPAAA